MYPEVMVACGCDLRKVRDTYDLMGAGYLPELVSYYACGYTAYSRVNLVKDQRRDLVLRADDIFKSQHYP